MLRPLITFVLWALLGALVVGLGLRLTAKPLPAHGALTGATPAPVAGLERLFGAAAAPADAAEPLPAADARFRLLGVVAASAGRGGVALLSVDNGPPKAFRVGELVDGDLQLVGVEARSASLGRGSQAQLQLPLQTPPPAALSFAPAPTAAPTTVPQGAGPGLPPAQLPNVPGAPSLLPGAAENPPPMPLRGGDDEAGPRRPAVNPPTAR